MLGMSQDKELMSVCVYMSFSWSAEQETLWSGYMGTRIGRSVENGLDLFLDFD